VHDKSAFATKPEFIAPLFANLLHVQQIGDVRQISGSQL
jgi:hypothetical protein